jgi:valyl-tRNA synthetase
VAQQVLAHALDVLVRLLHPLIPFLTEEIWQLLSTAAPRRGLQALPPAAESVMIAPWPAVDAARIDERTEARFAGFQQLLAGLRETRSRQNVPPKSALRFAARCAPEVADLLRPMEPYFESMAGARATAWGPAAPAPALCASFVAAGVEVLVDLAGLIDVQAEIARKSQELAKLAQLIAGKEKQLANQNFVTRAPADVLAKERAALAQLQQQHQAAAASLQALAPVQTAG